MGACSSKKLEKKESLPKVVEKKERKPIELKPREESNLMKRRVNALKLEASKSDMDLDSQHQSLVPSIGDVSNHLKITTGDFSRKFSHPKATSMTTTIEESEIARKVPISPIKKKETDTFRELDQGDIFEFTKKKTIVTWIPQMRDVNSSKMPKDNYRIAVQV